MNFNEKYMNKLNQSITTVLEGDGEFLDYESGEVYKIHNIKLPFNSSGKHICVFSKEKGNEDVLENREYFDGKILNFKIIKIEYWE